MKNLLKFFKGYFPQTLLAPFFKLCEVVFELLVPMIMAQIINIGIKNGDRRYIVMMCGLLVLLGAIGLGFALTAQYFAALSAAGFAAKLRFAMFSKINSLSFSQLDRLGSSTVITRMTSDLNQLQNGVNMTLRLALRSPFVVFGALLGAFLIDARSSLVFLAAIVLLFAVIFIILLICIPLYRRVQGRLDSVLKRTRENLSGIRVIRAFRLENSENKRFNDENGELYRSQIFVGKVSALLNPLTYVMINLAVVLLIYSGAVQGMPQGSVVAMYNYMLLILAELIKLANIIITINRSLACADRISDILAIDTIIPKDDGTALNVNAPAVEFRNVSLDYSGSGNPALDNISITLNKGETLGVIGGTGSGKSSLAALIPHFYDSTSGSVLIFGKDVKTYDNTALRQRIGIVLQSAALFSGTVKDNICLGNENASDEEVIEALKTAQAYEFVEKLPGGIYSKVAQNGKNFSGGQRQRLSIARAIVKKPDILILDDSSSALDAATDLQLRKAIADLPYTAAVIIISQRTAQVAFADKILVLDDGKAAGYGTHDELLKTCPVYKEIYLCGNTE